MRLANCLVSALRSMPEGVNSGPSTVDDGVFANPHHVVRLRAVQQRVRSGGQSEKTITDRLNLDLPLR